LLHSIAEVITAEQSEWFQTVFSFSHHSSIQGVHYNEPFELTDKMFKKSHVLLLIHQSNRIQIMHNARVACDSKLEELSHS
jgi:hypothetical protein